MAVHNAAQACDLIIFGTKGDLARRSCCHRFIS